MVRDHFWDQKPRLMAVFAVVPKVMQLNNYFSPPPSLSSLLLFVPHRKNGQNQDASLRERFYA